MKLVIVRGLPGSGKTTTAKALSDDESVLVSADDFFYLLGQGTYEFDQKRISEAHQFCLRQTIKAMKNQVPSIIIHNNFCKTWEYETYVDLALLQGYEVVVVTLYVDVEVCLKRQIHNVPEEIIRFRAENFDDPFERKGIKNLCYHP